MTKILAIDDSKTMRLAIKITFAAEEAEVVAVSKGSEAVARAKQMGADIVLVDHTLAPSEPSGFDVVRALKSDPATSGKPVLMLVPAKGEFDASQVEACGADGTVAKPFDSQELIDSIQSALGKPVAKPAAAKPAVARPAAKPVAKPAPAAPPAAARPAAKPAPAAAKPVAKPAPAAAKPAAAAPPVGRAARPPSGPKPAAPARPAARPVAKPAPASPAARPGPVLGKPGARPGSGPSPTASSGKIPVVTPIPFAMADAPTSGMLERLKAAAAQGGGTAGLDPKAVQALVALTAEVVEQVVWEVVPEMAEALISEKANQ